MRTAWGNVEKKVLLLFECTVDRCNTNESAHFSLMVIFILKAQTTEPGRNPRAFKLRNQNTFILYISVFWEYFLKIE